MVALLFILRCGRSDSFSPSPRQAFAPAAVIQCNPSLAVILSGNPPADDNTHLSASSKGRGDRAAEFQLDFFPPVNMSVGQEFKSSGQN